MFALLAVVVDVKEEGVSTSMSAWRFWSSGWPMMAGKAALASAKSVAMSSGAVMMW